MTKGQQLDLTSVALRHWKLIAGLTFAFVVLAAVITHFLPHQYQSEMKFLVNNGRTDLILSPDTGQTTITPSEVTETQLNSELELLNSHDILDAVVADQKLYLPFQHGDEDPPSLLSSERARLKLQKALSISALRTTDVIVVTYKNTNPDRAVTVLQDIKTHYMAAHLRAHGAPGSDRFFSAQVAEYKQKLAAAQGALAAFHRQTQIYSFPQQQSALVERLERTDSQIESTDADIHADQARLHQGALQMAAIPPRATTQVKQTSDQMALEQLEPALVLLENHRIDLASKFNPNDRFVVEADRQIANTKSQIARIRSDRMNEETTDRDPLYESIKTDSAKARIDLSGLQMRRSDAALQRANTLQALNAMDSSSVQLQMLEQTVKQAHDNYQLYTQRLDEVRLAEALDRDKLSNVVLIEKPSVSPIAVSPSPQLNLAVAFVAGLALSFVLAFLFELRTIQLPVVRKKPAAVPHFAESMLQTISRD